MDQNRRTRTNRRRSQKPSRTNEGRGYDERPPKSKKAKAAPIAEIDHADTVGQDAEQWGEVEKLEAYANAMRVDRGRPRGA